MNAQLPLTLEFKPIPDNQYWEYETALAAIRFHFPNSSE